MSVRHVEFLVEEPSMEAARAIAQHWEPARNTSTSFRVLRDVLQEMAI